MSECSKELRKIGKSLRILANYDNAVAELQAILSMLYEANALQSYKWMTTENKHCLRDLLFAHIQTIGHIFIQNEQQNNTKSLKTDIKVYRSFFQSLSRLISDPSSDLFSGKQIKMIRLLSDSVMNYQSDCQQSILEKQHELLQRKRMELDIDQIIKSNGQYNGKHDGNDIMNKLRSKLTKQRLDRCEMVLQHRTDRVYLVLDSCYDVRNQCAMLRTAELFGIQNIWIVKPVNYKNMRVFDSISRHSQLWLTLRYFESSLHCVTALREEQKQREIWCMDLGKDALELSLDTIHEYRTRKRVFPEYVAIVMGKEAEGPSQEFLKYCNQKVYLSQFGFCESFNVSVACALGLQSIFAMNPEMRGQMDEMERNRLRYLWYYQLVNDKELKEELKALVDGNAAWMDHEREISLSDFRRNEFKHWDAKKINCRLRKRIKQQQREQFMKTRQ